MHNVAFAIYMPQLSQIGSHADVAWCWEVLDPGLWLSCGWLDSCSCLGLSSPRLKPGMPDREHRMQLVLPDILDEVRGFSPLFSCLAVILGLLLWLLGWRGHRFWIVLIATIVAGVAGLLYSGPAHTTQPIVAGLLLAMSAGVMALALVRLIAFAAGGAAAFLAVHALAPQWQQPLLSFLAGGLFSLVLFRLWTIAVTSAAGTLLLAYSSLCLLNAFGKVDVVALAERRVTAINCICGGVALLGLIAQLVLDRLRSRRPSPERSEKPPAQPPAPRHWWSRAEHLYRRAG